MAKGVDRSDATSILAQEWGAAGLADADMVLVHSSISRILRRLRQMGAPPDPEIVLDSLLEAIGPRGTLLLPLFNFGFSEGKAFDIATTPSQMGALTEIARLHRDSVRTGHPIYSFAVLGFQRAEFEDVVNFSGYGPDSPFGILHRSNGKIAVIDLPDQQSMTFYHYVEEANSVSYRYHKTFEGLYAGADGRKQTRSFGLFVRKIEEGVITSVDPMGERLWQRGLYSGDLPRHGSGMRVISASALFEEVTQVIKKGLAKGLLYEIDPTLQR